MMCRRRSNNNNRPELNPILRTLQVWCMKFKKPDKTFSMFDVNSGTQPLSTRPRGARGRMAREVEVDVEGSSTKTGLGV